MILAQGNQPVALGVVVQNVGNWAAVSNASFLTQARRPRS